LECGDPSPLFFTGTIDEQRRDKSQLTKALTGQRTP
jgi:hypothetical protein